MRSPERWADCALWSEGRRWINGGGEATLLRDLSVVDPRSRKLSGLASDLPSETAGGTGAKKPAVSL